jgi:transcriptional regulator with GAF, ATPase, and Fis domain
MAFANILQHQEIIRLKDILYDDNMYLQQQMRKMGGDSLIGTDSGLRNVMNTLQQLSRVDTPVLLRGETGVGKEIVANVIHSSSKRRNGPYITVNCGAIPENLIDSELFGHEKGAFTGAVSHRRGRFERAHRGTILLDEIGELPLSAQVRLLRVLQQQEIERVGGAETIPVDVRVVSATHRNLEELVLSGKFREDLYFRINVFPVEIPPLRQRVDDIPLLVNHFIETKSKKLGVDTVPPVTREALDQLQAYHWPGNVRELENLVERALIQSHVVGPDTFLKLDELFMPFPKKAHDGSPEEPLLSLADAMASHIMKALEKTGGKIGGPSGAASLLGLNPNTLRSRMKKLGVRYESSGGQGMPSEH